jgi:hypothetical protein
MGTTGNPKRSTVINGFTITDPYDIVFNGREVTFDFNFISDNFPNVGGKLNLNPIIRVPAYFRLFDFARRDTTSVNMEEIAKIFDDSSALSMQNITFYLNVTNGLPLLANLQVYFADANYRIIDSLQTHEIVLESGIPDPSTFLVKTPVVTTEEISMDKKQFDKIKPAKYLIFKESFTSHGVENSSVYIKLFKSNFMKILLSVKIDTKLNGNLSDISY